MNPEIAEIASKSCHSCGASKIKFPWQATVITIANQLGRDTNLDPKHVNRERLLYPIGLLLQKDVLTLMEFLYPRLFGDRAMDSLNSRRALKNEQETA